MRATNLENDTEERDARTTVNNLSETFLSKIGDEKQELNIRV